MDLNDFAKENFEEAEKTEAQEETERKTTTQRPPETEAGEPIVTTEELSKVVERVTGYGLSGSTRESFDEEFEALANIIGKLVGLDEATEVMSLKSMLSPEARATLGIVGVLVGGIGWRYVINLDKKAGGERSPTGKAESGKKKKQKSEEQKEGEKGEKGEKETSMAKSFSDMEVE